MSTDSPELLKRFVRGGFEALIDAEPIELASYLRTEAAHTGRSSLLFLAETIEAVYALFSQHEESGGIRLGFINKLDDLACERLPVIQRSDPHWAAKLAKDFRDDILALVEAYDPRNAYE